VEETQMNYMLDTNVFGDLVGGVFCLEDLPPDGQFWATPVQWEELTKAPASVKARFRELILDHGRIVPAGFAFDVLGAGWGEGEWRQDGRLWYALNKELDELLESGWANHPPKEEKQRQKKENNRKDASIAEAAKFNNFTLITRDCGLMTAATKHGITVLDPGPRRANCLVL
jgi:hypothetical protein